MFKVKAISLILSPDFFATEDADLVSSEPLSEYAPGPGRIRIITSGEGEKLPESRDREDVISYPLT